MTSLVMHTGGDREVLSFLNFDSDVESDDYDDSLPFYSDDAEEYTPETSAGSSPMPTPIETVHFEQYESEARGTFYLEVPSSFFIETAHGVEMPELDEADIEAMMTAAEHEMMEYEDAGDDEDEDDCDDEEDDDEESSHSVLVSSEMLVMHEAATASMDVLAHVPDRIPTTPSSPRKRRLSISSVSSNDDCESTTSTAPATPSVSSPERKRTRIEERFASLLSRRPNVSTVRSLARLLGTSASAGALQSVDFATLSQATLLALHEQVDGALKESDDHTGSKQKRRSRKPTSRRKNAATVLFVDAHSRTSSSEDDVEEDDEEIDVVNM